MGHPSTLADRIRSGEDTAEDGAALAELPDDLLDLDPWLHYGRAWNLMPRDEYAARHHLLCALDRFEAARDTHACVCAAAAMLILIADHNADYRGLTRYLGHFRQRGQCEGLSPLLALRLHAAAVVLPELNQDADVDAVALTASADSVYAALRAGLARPANERLLIGRLLLDRTILDQDAERFHLIAAMLHPLVDDASVSPYWKGVWWWRLAVGHADFGDHEAARTSRARAGALADEAGLAELEFRLTEEDVAEALSHGDIDAAGRKVARLAALSPTMGSIPRAKGLVHTARYHLQRGEPALTLTLCARAITLFEENELPLRELAWPLSLMAHAHLFEGREDAALELFERIRPHLSRDTHMLDALVALSHAARAVRTEAPDHVERVRAAMASLHAIQWPRFFITLPQLAARLFEVALTHGIERDFVVQAIRSRTLPAPDLAHEAWPWALRIRALGGFMVEREDQPIGFERKAQKKPLELLKALVAAGGAQVPREALAHALWPDPGADALVSFDVTLSRLRKLLDVDAALPLENGKLSLNRRVVWCDAEAFESRVDRLLAALAHADGVAVQAQADEVFRLYRGKLFGDEPATPWSAAPRERLGVRFSRAVIELGDWLEARAQWRPAIERYESALAHLMLSEPLYRGLMRCHLALGEPTEALLAFRRCRDMLSLVLGMSPGPETMALHAQIRGEPAPGRSTP